MYTHIITLKVYKEKPVCYYFIKAIRMHAYSPKKVDKITLFCQVKYIKAKNFQPF